MIKHITAPAPRFLLRLFEIERALRDRKALAGPHLSVGELGPGLGDVAAWLLDNPAVDSVSLIESSLKALTLLRARFETEPAACLLSSFPPEVNHFNLFLAFEVLEHLEDDQAMLSQIHRALAQEGLLVGSVPAFMRKWETRDDMVGHIRRYERSELQKKLECAGFRDIAINVYGFPVTNMLYPFRELYYRNKRRRMSEHSRQEATHMSGIDRDLVQRLDKRLVFSLLKILSPLQRLPLLCELGDGFLFSARK